MPQPRLKAPSADVLLRSGLIPRSYLDEYNQYDTNYQNELARVGGDERNYLRDLGLTQLGPEGYQLDPTAQFGMFQRGLQGLQEQLRGARTANIGRGIGRRGLAAAKERLLRSMGAGDQASILSGGLKTLGGYNTQRQTALSARNTGQGRVYGEAADYWAQYAPDDPAPPAIGGWQDTTPPADGPISPGTGPGIYDPETFNPLANPIGPSYLPDGMNVGPRTPTMRRRAAGYSGQVL